MHIDMNGNTPDAKRAKRSNDQSTLRHTNIGLDMVLGVVPPTGRKTKIVCTIGVTTGTVEALCELLAAGMNVARLNFSHGDHKSHGQVITNVREACKIKNTTCGILLDTKGPEIRTGFLVDHKPVNIEKGQMVTLTTDYTFLGDGKTLAISYKNITKQVAPGNMVLVADGVLSLTVLKVESDKVICRANNTGVLGERKNVNLPGVDVDLPTITEKDREDLRFGVEQGVDFVAASFVRSGNDVKVIREALGEMGKSILILSKIENKQGLVNFDDILAQSDGIMVARGDLGMEIPPQKVFLAQKMMINRCNAVGKPVITATQMLESMTKNPRPTRAEAGDVANAVFDGTDCVMLSGETASGDYPLQSVEIMASICREAEEALDYDSLFTSLRVATPQPMKVTEGVACSAVKSAQDTQAALILVFTETGKTSRYVSKYCPQAPILVITRNPQTARQTHISWGCTAYLETGDCSKGHDVVIGEVLEFAKKSGLCKVGDRVVAIHGVHYRVEGGTNMFRVVNVK